MIIIGKTEVGFICDVTDAEIAKLTGYYSQYSNAYKNQKLEMR